MPTDIDKGSRPLNRPIQVQVRVDDPLLRAGDGRRKQAAIGPEDRRTAASGGAHHAPRGGLHLVNPGLADDGGGVQDVGLGFDCVGAGEGDGSCNRFAMLADTEWEGSGPNGERGSTLARHAIQTLLFIVRVEQRRPGGDVDLLALRIRVVLEEGLDVLPAREGADAPGSGGVNHAVEAVAERVAEDGPFHVRGFDLLAQREDLPVRVDDRLRDVQGVVDVLREAQHHGDLVLRRAALDRRHLRGVDLQGVLDVQR